MNEELFSAVGHGDVERVRILLDSGADVNSLDDNGITALHRAAVEGKTETAALLLDRGADVNPRDNSGYTPLGRALGKPRMEELLRQHGGVE